MNQVTLALKDPYLLTYLSLASCFKSLFLKGEAEMD